MSIWECEVCGYTYDEAKEDSQWSQLPDEWLCPICESSKENFFNNDDQKAEEPQASLPQKDVETVSLSDLERSSDGLESYMSDIHQMAKTGESITEPMRTRSEVISWEDILIKGAQVARLPLNKDVSVSTKTIIGPNAKHPLILEGPAIVSHMSFGALSREAKIALARGSAKVKTAMCSGEGGILLDEMESSYKYIFEYVPNQYSVTEKNLKEVDAIEIKFGQSAKPGMGGHLPGKKVTREIAEIRGFQEGSDIVSPAHFEDLKTGNDIKAKIDWLRDCSGGKPVGVKIAAGNIEDDLEVVVKAGPDFITIDGRAGATAAAPKYVKLATSIPTVFALYRARKYLDRNNYTDISLIITGGFRISADIAKALALGANAVALGTAALIACGCQQYRICNTGNCPVGIATQDENLRARFDIDESAVRLANYLRVTNEELKNFARLTGNDDVHKLSVNDLCTTNSEISGYTEIQHV